MGVIRVNSTLCRLTGSISADKLLQIQQEVTSILRSGGFELRKWLYNTQNLLTKCQKETLESSNSVLQLALHENKTLGIV